LQGANAAADCVELCTTLVSTLYIADGFSPIVGANGRSRSAIATRRPDVWRKTLK
jgi:hypothetical protein